MEQNSPNMNMPPVNNDVEQGKTIAIISYITLIGWIIAFVMHQSNKTKFGAYHIRQSLGLAIFAVGCFIVFMIIGVIMPFLFLIAPLVDLGILVLLILGIVNAANGQEKPVPIIGELSAKLLAGIN